MKKEIAEIILLIALTGGFFFAVSSIVLDRLDKIHSIESEQHEEREARLLAERIRAAARYNYSQSNP